MPLLHRLLPAALLLLAVAGETASAQVLVAETEPLMALEQQSRFHLPEGFEIQLVACEPVIGQPMNLRFDAAGRLWVTSSVEP